MIIEIKEIEKKNITKYALLGTNKVSLSQLMCTVIFLQAVETLFKISALLFYDDLLKIMQWNYIKENR